MQDEFSDVRRSAIKVIKKIGNNLLDVVINRIFERFHDSNDDSVFIPRYSTSNIKQVIINNPASFFSGSRKNNCTPFETAARFFLTYGKGPVRFPSTVSAFL